MNVKINNNNNRNEEEKKEDFQLVKGKLYLQQKKKTTKIHGVSDRWSTQNS